MLVLFYLPLLVLWNMSASAQEQDTELRFSQLEDKILGLHIYFDAEIRSLRRTLRTELAIRRSLEDRMAKQDICGTTAQDSEESKEMGKSEGEGQHNQSYRTQSTCMHRFQNVSRRVDNLDSRIERLANCINGENNTSSTCSVLGEFEQEINQITETSLEIKDDISALEVKVFELRSLHQNESEEKVDRSVCLEQNVYRGARSDRLFLTKPFFVSEWLLMKSQDDELSEIFINHGLGQHPLKVDVQLRPISGQNAGWIFPGTGSPQSDDDQSVPYGGIVYIYNEKLLSLLYRGNTTTMLMVFSYTRVSETPSGSVTIINQRLLPTYVSKSGALKIFHNQILQRNGCQ